MKYLLEVHHGIGDIVQYTGLAKSIKEYDKDAFIGIVINKEAYGTLLRLDPDINRIYVIDFKGNRRALIKSILSIRREKYDYMVCSLFSRQTSMEFMAIAFGARKVAGSRLDRIANRNSKYIFAVVDETDHVVKQNQDVLRALLPEVKDHEPYLICPEPPYAVPDKAIGLCLGTSIPQKTWDLENYIEIGDYFESKGYSIVLLGGSSEQAHFNSKGIKRNKWLNLLGKTDLTESASECSKCELIIGGDTGLMHMAAAVGTKTLTLFTCSEPTTHAPYSKHSYYYYHPEECQFCYNTEAMWACNEHKCVKNIKTEIIKDIVEGILLDKDTVEQYRLKINS